MNLHFLLVIIALAAIGWLAQRLAMRHLVRPPTAEEVKRMRHDIKMARLARIDREAGLAPRIWVPKRYGPLGVRSFRAMDYFNAMRGWSMRNLPEMILSNVGGHFYPHGMKTMYPSDVVPGSATNPYLNRYMLVQQAPPGTTLSATLAPSYTIDSTSICNVYPTGNPSQPTVPIGIMTDDVGNTALDAVPYGGAVQLLCGAARQTTQAVADAVITAGSLLIPSRTTAGYLGNVPAIAGIYWCVGFAGNTSEGAATEIDLVQNLFPVSVDEIT